MIQSCSFIKTMKPHFHHPYLQALNLCIKNVLGNLFPNIPEEKNSIKYWGSIVSNYWRCEEGNYGHSITGNNT